MAGDSFKQFSAAIAKSDSRKAFALRAAGCLRVESLEVQSLLSVSIPGIAVPDNVAPLGHGSLVPLISPVHRLYPRAGFAMPTASTRSLSTTDGGRRRQRHDDRHRRRLRRSEHRQRPARVRRAVRPARPGVHQGESDRRRARMPAADTAGPRRSPWTSSGPTPSPRRPTSCWSRPAATTVSDLMAAVDTAREHAGRRRRVDELGRRRVLAARRATTAISRLRPATPASPSWLFRRQRRRRPATRPSRRTSCRSAARRCT